jgi:hypothetical protein
MHHEHAIVVGREWQWRTVSVMFLIGLDGYHISVPQQLEQCSFLSKGTCKGIPTELASVHLTFMGILYISRPTGICKTWRAPKRVRGIFPEHLERLPTYRCVIKPWPKGHQYRVLWRTIRYRLFLQTSLALTKLKVGIRYEAYMRCDGISWATRP